MSEFILFNSQQIEELGCFEESKEKGLDEIALQDGSKKHNTPLPIVYLYSDRKKIILAIMNYLLVPRNSKDS